MSRDPRNALKGQSGSLRGGSETRFLCRAQVFVASRRGFARRLRARDRTHSGFARGDVDLFFQFPQGISP